MDFEIITDSCCNLPEDMIDELGLHILPMTFMVEGKQYQSYLKGERTDLKQFYTMMREGKVVTTSTPNMNDAEALMRSLLDQGKDIIYIAFSSGLSSTYQSASLMMSELANEYPDRKVIIVDSLAAAAGQGLLVWYAARMAKEGATLEAVQEWVEYNKLHMAHWFTVEDLMYLLRGGRVSKTSAWAGTILNIKPVLHVDDEGHLIPLEKIRGRRKSLIALVDHMERTAIQPIADQTVFLGHGDCPKDAEFLANLIRERLGVKNIITTYIDPVIGAHAGPGIIAVFFLATER